MAQAPTGPGIVIRQAHFPGRAPIDAYGNGGFRFADMSHRGSILCLPSGIYGWEPKDPAAIDIDDLARVFAESDDIEILLVGMGRDLRPIPKPVREALRAAGISSDPMSTGAALRTFNVLLADGRAVAAALIAVE
ncbi:Mth938-like domain-containing protein [Mesorhizobium sp. J428]|uniref:Mth938-like domain-containing protein n=1 Tax=Mesorhizobium sp. J428 TaxID=2898440 RepID=UPI002150DAD9|nr:Mth938-like domain-containing protein [Mesorhizobium sp. J428]MCR5859890.1 Mth938-like domain-containing protein [Mesorhizobium sp. J428]